MQPRRAGISVMAGGVVLVAALIAAMLWSTDTRADTIFPPATGAFSVQVVTDGNTYSYPNGGPGRTLPDVVDGQDVTVTINDPAGGPLVNFSRLRVRQCASDRVVDNNTEFNPQIFNRCSSATLGTGTPSAYVDSGPVAPGTTTISVNFKIGEGTAPDVVSAFDGELYPGFDCGPGAPCKLVVNAEVTTGSGSSNYVSFPISFFEEPVTETVLVDCDKVAGTTAFKPFLTNASQNPVAMAAKSTVGAAGQYPRTCTGALAAGAGPLTKVAGKLTGPMSCATAAPATSTAPNGKFTFTWTELGINGKPLTSATYVRIDQTADLIDEVSIASGLVTKGVGVGSDVRATVLLQPTLKNGPADQSVLAADGTLVPGTGSSTLATGCATGANTIATGLFSTDGTSLTGTPLNSSFQFVLP